MSAKPKPPTILPAEDDLRGVVAFNVRLLMRISVIVTAHSGAS